MKPWMGVAAVAAAMLFVPSAAMAGNDDPALLKFQRAERGAVRRLRGPRPRHEPRGRQERRRLDHRSGVGHRPAARLGARPGLRERRRRPRQVQRRPHPRRAQRGHRGRGRREDGPGAPTRPARPAERRAGTVRAQRADFYENNVGRFISIEANTTQASVTCTNPNTGSGCQYTGPVLQAAAYDANNKPIVQGALTTYLDPDPSAAPDYYQYHYQIFRIGNKGDGGPDPAYVKISAPNGDVDTIPRRNGCRRTRPATRRPSSTTSTRATTPRRRATPASTTWRPSTPTSPRSSRLRPGATCAARRPWSATSRRPT